MKRAVLFLLASLLGLPLFAQEVAIFKDHRSLVIQSHREAAGWTYLRLSGGELAVRSSDLLTIVAEKGARPPALPAAGSFAAPAAASPPYPRPAFVRERPAAPPVPQETVGAEEGDEEETGEEEPDDAEAEAEAAATKPPDQPPKPGADQKPVPPPGLAPPNLNMDGPVPTPQPKDD